MNREATLDPRVEAGGYARASAGSGLARTWQSCRVFTIAGQLETLRRKDLYVLVVLTALMVLGLVFHVRLCPKTKCASTIENDYHYRL